MFDIHQILYQDKEGYSQSSPHFSTCHALDGCGNPSLLSQPAEGLLQIPAGRDISPPERVMPPPVRGNNTVCLSPLPRSLSLTVTSRPMILSLSQNLHGLDLDIPEIPDYSTIGTAEHSLSETQWSVFPLTVMDRISLDIETSGLLYPNSFHAAHLFAFCFLYQKPCSVRPDDIILKGTGKCGEQCAVSSDTDYQMFILLRMFLCIQQCITIRLH